MSLKPLSICGRPREVVRCRIGRGEGIFNMAASNGTIVMGAVQLCPKCGIPMSVSDVIPTMPTAGLDEDEVVYRCHHCGAEVIRIFERHRSASGG